MSDLRPEFEAAIQGWSISKHLESIPVRLKVVEQLGPLNEEEQKIINFMKDVQALREKFVRK